MKFIFSVKLFGKLSVGATSIINANKLQLLIIEKAIIVKFIYGERRRTMETILIFWLEE